MHISDYILLVLVGGAGIAAAIGGIVLTLPTANFRAARVSFWVVALCFGLLGVIWAVAAEHPGMLIRMAIAGLTAAIAAVVLVWVLSLLKPESKRDLAANEGILVPANLPSPAFAPNCGFPAGSFSVIAGANVMGSDKFPHTVLRMAGDDMIVFDKEANGNLVLSTLKIFDDRNDVIARLDRDGFWVQNAVRKKRPDEHTLVVFDRSDQEVLNIKFLNPQTLLVSGIFRHPRLPTYLVVSNSDIQQKPNGMTMMRSCFYGNGADIVLDAGGIGLGAAH